MPAPARAQLRRGARRPAMPMSSSGRQAYRRASAPPSGASSSPAGRRVRSTGSTQILAEHGLGNLKRVETLADVEALAAGQAGACRPAAGTGFETDTARRRRRAGHSRRPAGAALEEAQARRRLHRRSGVARRPATSSSTPIMASAASSACARSRRWARRMIASKSTMPATTGCSCRSKTSSFCRATGPMRPRPPSTSLAAAPGNRARRG